MGEAKAGGTERRDRLPIMPTQAHQNVVVVGQGYVGLPLTVACLEAGHRVSGIDVDPLRISLLKNGHSPVKDVPSYKIKNAIEKGMYVPSDDYASAANFDVALITVPTPLKEGEPDASFIESAGKSLAYHLRRGAMIILESTTYPGTTEELLLPILEEGSGLKAGSDFFLGYSPERIDPGNNDWNLLNTPKVVSGIDRVSRDAVEAFYKQLGISTVSVGGTREAELTKLLENTFRHVNIALVNELSRFSRPLGVDLWEAINAAATKPFGYMKFTPGPGVGGHCLPIDPTYLSWAVKEKSGAVFNFVTLANTVNASMPGYVVERASELIGRTKGSLEGARIVIVGLAYKPDTGDIRESPALAIAKILEESGARVYGVDSHVPDELWPADFERVEIDDDEPFELSIIVTNHSNGVDHWVLERSGTVLDTRNCVSGESVEQL